MAENPYPHLDDVGFVRLAPAVALRPFVRWYWLMRSNGRLYYSRDEFMHTDGGTGLVFNWGDQLELPAGSYPQDVKLDTVWAQSRRLLLSGEVNIFGIRFRPGGAYALFGIPMNELTETAVLSDHLVPGQLTQFHERLYALDSFAEKVLLVEEWLIGHLRQNQALSPLVSESLAKIAGAQGQLPVQHVADSVYVSARQLERLFKTQVGMSPKRFARLMRMRQAREMLKQTGSQALVAQSSGFYDQAHFIREFKTVVGMTPGAYASRRG